MGYNAYSTSVAQFGTAHLGTDLKVGRFRIR